MPLTDHIKELYHIEENPLFREKHYRMCGVLEELTGTHQLSSQNRENSLDLFALKEDRVVSTGFLGLGTGYFITPIHGIPYLVLEDPSHYQPDEEHPPVFLIEGLNDQDDLLFLQEVTLDPLLVEQISTKMVKYQQAAPSTHASSNFS